MMGSWNNTFCFIIFKLKKDKKLSNLRGLSDKLK